MNVVIIGMYNQQELLGFESMACSQLIPMFLACTVVTITAIGKPGEGMGFGEVILHSWIQLTKTKINWFKLPHDPASGLWGPSSSDAGTRP